MTDKEKADRYDALKLAHSVLSPFGLGECKRCPFGTALCRKECINPIMYEEEWLQAWKGKEAKIEGHTTHYYVCGECGCPLIPPYVSCHKCGTIVRY